MLTSYELNIHWASYCSTGHDIHRSVRSASSRLASSSSSTGSGSGRRGSRPISRGTGSGLDSKLLPDVLLGAVGASTSRRPRDAMGWRSNKIALQRGHEIVCKIDVNNPEDIDSPEFCSADVDRKSVV